MFATDDFRMFAMKVRTAPMHLIAGAYGFLPAASSLGSDGVLDSHSERVCGQMHPPSVLAGGFT